MNDPLVALAIVALAASPAAAQVPTRAHPRPVTTADFTVGGVRWGADTAQVKRVLGEPTRRGSYKWPDADEPLPAWTYPDAEFGFDVSGGVLIVTLRGPTAKTTRGISRGSTAAMVHRAYGSPSDSASSLGDTWIYDAQDDSGVALMFTITHGRVVDIMMGTVPGMD